ncbi:MAG: DUF2971 domain-containing protein [Candidatus Celaenobacter antarcticus]|nr:DUF2971 domain-containing protein [Candidatus Celaenobacter antarcticus]
MFEKKLKKELKYIISNVPILYKYIDFKGGKKLLSSSYLLIKKPSTFDDPYDCFTSLIDFNNMPDSYFKYLINKYIDFSTKKDTIEQCQLYNNKISKNKLAKLYGTNFFPIEKENWGVLCFSEKYENLLMWSQYSDSHKGICIGMNLKKLYLSFKSMEIKEITLLKVKYLKKFKTYDYFKNKKEAIINWLRIKSKDWEYEREIRFCFGQIIPNNLEEIPVEIAKDVINQIYLGSNMDSHDQNEVIEICKKNYPNADIFKMRLDKCKFKLIPEKIQADSNS